MGEIWKPNDCSRLKLKVKKRSSLSGVALKNGPLSPLSSNLSARVGKNVKATKRKNPFQCDRIRLKLAKCQEVTSDNKENELPNFKLNHNRPPNFVLKSISGEADDGITIQTANGKSELPQNDMTFSCLRNSEGFPTDWSLKTKLKFKSDEPFSWCTSLKSNVASRGTANFIRCLNVSNPDGVTNKEVDLKINFVKSLSYWKHPNLPCIPSFPLTESENHTLEGSFTNICKDLNMRENIMATWRHSFQSVFTLARCGFCPYFYMCCQKFSCLFISSGVSDKEMVAIVTPTTKGLRGLLHKEGIAYEMPHLKDDSKDNTHLEDDENGVDTDEDFLSSIGLNKKQFSSIEKHRFASELSQLNYVDNRAQSTLLVKDCHVNALFNFFVNSDVIVAHSGAWQGVPPTLLAPVAFEGASLQKLQCMQGPMKVPHKGGLKQVNCLDISGPVLPSHFYSICQLVKEANKSFEATIYTNAQSNAFNCMSDNQQTTLHDDQIYELGISRSCVEYLGKVSLNNNEALSFLKFSDGMFEWKVHSLQ